MEGVDVTVSLLLVIVVTTTTGSSIKGLITFSLIILLASGSLIVVHEASIKVRFQYDARSVTAGLGLTTEAGIRVFGGRLVRRITFVR